MFCRVAFMAWAAVVAGTVTGAAALAFMAKTARHMKSVVRVMMVKTHIYSFIKMHLRYILIERISSLCAPHICNFMQLYEPVCLR